jgi:hypothetical protein
VFDLTQELSRSERIAPPMIYQRDALLATAPTLARRRAPLTTCSFFDPNIVANERQNDDGWNRAGLASDAEE